MIVRIEEDRLLKCGFADFVVTAPDNSLVVGVGFDDFEAEGFHGLGVEQTNIRSSPYSDPLRHWLDIGGFLVDAVAIGSASP